MNRSLIAAVCVFTAAGATAALAAPHGHGKRFEQLDENGDGLVTADEMDAKRAALFDNADANGDGALSEDEMRAYHKAKREERRAKHNPDTNGDGVVDRNEYQAAADKRFDRMDKNGDGVLSEDELKQRRGRHHYGKRGE